MHAVVFKSDVLKVLLVHGRTSLLKPKNFLVFVVVVVVTCFQFFCSQFSQSWHFNCENLLILGSITKRSLPLEKERYTVIIYNCCLET